MNRAVRVFLWALFVAGICAAFWTPGSFSTSMIRIVPAAAIVLIYRRAVNTALEVAWDTGVGMLHNVVHTLLKRPGWTLVSAAITVGLVVMLMSHHAMVAAHIAATVEQLWRIRVFLMVAAVIAILLRARWSFFSPIAPTGVRSTFRESIAHLLPRGIGALLLTAAVSLVISVSCVDVFDRHLASQQRETCRKYVTKRELTVTENIDLQLNGLQHFVGIISTPKLTLERARTIERPIHEFTHATRSKWKVAAFLIRHPERLEALSALTPISSDEDGGVSNTAWAALTDVGPVLEAKDKKRPKELIAFLNSDGETLGLDDMSEMLSNDGSWANASRKLESLVEAGDAEPNGKDRMLVDGLFPRRELVCRSELEYLDKAIVELLQRPRLLRTITAFRADEGRANAELADIFMRDESTFNAAEDAGDEAKAAAKAEREKLVAAVGTLATNIETWNELFPNRTADSCLRDFSLLCEVKGDEHALRIRVKPRLLVFSVVQFGDLVPILLGKTTARQRARFDATSSPEANNAALKELVDVLTQPYAPRQSYDITADLEPMLVETDEVAPSSDTTRWALFRVSMMFSDARDQRTSVFWEPKGKTLNEILSSGRFLDVFEEGPLVEMQGDSGRHSFSAQGIRSILRGPIRTLIYFLFSWATIHLIAVGVQSDVLKQASFFPLKHLRRNRTAPTTNLTWKEAWDENTPVLQADNENDAAVKAIHRAANDSPDLLPRAISAGLRAKDAAKSSGLSRTATETAVESAIDKSIEEWAKGAKQRRTFGNYVAYALPNIGFIGTIIGFSFGLSTARGIAIPSANPFHKSQVLAEMVSLLGTAFFTTLTALVCVLPLVLLMICLSGTTSYLSSLGKTTALTFMRKRVA